MGFEKDRKWVSEARFLPYLDECGGDETRAWELYEWNARIASALSECIHHLEVLLRNSMIAELEKLHPLDDPWTRDSSTIQQVASKRAKNANRPATADDVISGLNLGFWKGLLQDKPAENDVLWRTTLNRAFPHSRGDRKSVLDAVEDLFELRNRCAHQDSLLGFDVRVELKKILKLASWIDDNAATWIEGLERVTEEADKRPVKPQRNTAVIGSNTPETFEAFEHVSAMFNPTARNIAPVEYLGFYHSKRIEPYFPKVLEVVVPKVWKRQAAQEFLRSTDSNERHAGKAMSYFLDNGFQSDTNYEIYLLSGIQDPETLKLPTLSPIEHRSSGRGSGFVKGGLRYFSVNSLLAARDTSDLQ